MIICSKERQGLPLDQLYDSSALERETLKDVYGRCREGLTPEEFGAAWARGQTMTTEEAIALVAEAL